MNKVVKQTLVDIKGPDYCPLVGSGYTFKERLLFKTVFASPMKTDLFQKEGICSPWLFSFRVVPFQKGLG